MADINSMLAANRQAVDDLIAASERCADVWITPRAPGKWSPSQVVEHVARTFEESANLMSGGPTRLISLPSFVACAQAGGTVSSGAFGAVSVADHGRFIDVHNRHHCKQMP